MISNYIEFIDVYTIYIQIKSNKRPWPTLNIHMHKIHPKEENFRHIYISRQHHLNFGSTRPPLKQQKHTTHLLDSQGLKACHLWAARRPSTWRIRLYGRAGDLGMQFPRCIFQLWKYHPQSNIAMESIYENPCFECGAYRSYGDKWLSSEQSCPAA